MTFCKTCKHHIAAEQNTVRADIWYNHFCAASPRVSVTDPVTGKGGYSETNDLGRAVITDNKYRYCRDVNNGDCQLFEEGQPPGWIVVEEEHASTNNAQQPEWIVKSIFRGIMKYFE